jgi:hypothetical protein
MRQLFLDNSDIPARGDGKIDNLFYSAYPNKNRSGKPNAVLPCLDVYEGEMRRMEVWMRMRDEARGGGDGLQAPVPVGKLNKSKGLYNPAPSPF